MQLLFFTPMNAALPHWGAKTKRLHNKMTNEHRRYFYLRCVNESE